MELSVWKGTSIGKYVVIKDNVTIGDYVKIDDYVSLANNIVIEDNVTIRLKASLGENAKVGEGTFIAPHVVVLSLEVDDGSKNGVTIGKNCLIGCSAVIGPGVTICDNVKIGALSYVHSDITEEGTYVGQPARKVK